MAYTQQQRELLDASDTQKSIRVSICDNATPSPREIRVLEDEISYEGMSLEESLIDQEYLQFGKSNGATIKIKSKAIPEDIKGLPFKVTMLLRNERLNITDYFTIGWYKVKAVTRSADRKYIDIIGTDNMSMFDKDVVDWYNYIFSNPSEPPYFRNVLGNAIISLCHAVGCPVDMQYLVNLPNQEMELSQYISPKSLKGRDALEDLLEICGVFGHINKEGWFQPIRLEKSALYPSEDLYPLNTLYPRGGDREGGVLANDLQTYHSCIYEDYIVNPINSVAITNANGEIIGLYDSPEVTAQTETLNRYVVNGNIFLIGMDSTDANAMAENLYQLYKHFDYTPFKCDCTSGMYYELGTQVTVHGESGAFDSYVLKRQVSGIQAISTNIEAIGSEYINEYDIPMQTQFTNMQSQVNKKLTNGEGITLREDGSLYLTSSNIEIGDADWNNPVIKLFALDTYVNGNLHVQYGNFTVSGTKNRLVHTPHYGDRLLSAYETPCPMFGDTGHGKIGKDGKCYIYHDVVFLETINTKQDYQVFLQSYSENPVWISEKTEEYFVVSGTPDCEFDWEMKAKQRDYEITRLEESIPIAKEIEDE